MRGDEAELYRKLAPRVHATVRRQIRGSEQLVEDACHLAWVKFLERSEHVGRDGTLTWLIRTAIHDAYELSRRERRDLSLDDPAQTLEPAASAPNTDPSEQAEHRERLALTLNLRDRHRRLLWLQASGLSYDEIATTTGDSRRTVERQLLRAHAHLRQLDRDRDAAAIQPAAALTSQAPSRLRAGRNTSLRPLQRP